MSASECLPLCESAQKDESSGYYSLQKTWETGWEWSKCWMCIAPYGTQTSFY